MLQDEWFFIFSAWIGLDTAEKEPCKLEIVCFLIRKSSVLLRKPAVGLVRTRSTGNFRTTTSRLGIRRRPSAYFVLIHTKDTIE